MGEKVMTDKVRIAYYCLDFIRMQMDNVEDEGLRHRLAPRYKIDWEGVRHALDEARGYVDERNWEFAARVLTSLDQYFDTIPFGHGDNLGKNVKEVAHAFQNAASGGGNIWRATWFEITHSFRRKGSVGVSTSPDLSKFMLVEFLANVFGVITGIIVPIVQLDAPWSLLCLGVYIVMAGINLAGLALKTYGLRLTVGLVSLFLFYRSFALWADPTNELVALSGLGGAIFGVTVATGWAYNIARRNATKYGPYAALWARQLTKKHYEVILYDSDGLPVWRRHMKGHFNRLLDLVTGTDVADSLEARVRRRDAQSPYGGWIHCYPGLIGIRMRGLRRRNPASWGEALGTTPGVNKHNLDAFFARLTTPLHPPLYEDILADPTYNVAPNAPW